MLLRLLFASIFVSAAPVPTTTTDAKDQIVTIENFYQIIDERNIWSIHDKDFVPSWSLVSTSNLEQLNQAFVKNNITSRNEIAMFLAQSIYQTSGFSTINDWNLPFKYFIRGYFRELSEEDDYRQISQSMFNDDRLVTNPSLAVEGTTPIDIAIWYWTNIVKPFPGVKNSDGTLNFGAITRVVQPGVCSGPSPKTGLQENGWPIIGAGSLTFKLYDIAYRALKVDEPKSSDCGCMTGKYEVSKTQLFQNNMKSVFESKLNC